MMEEQSTDTQKELHALSEVARVLEPLNDAAVSRVLMWAADRFGVETSLNREQDEPGTDESNAGSLSFESAADLYTAASPSDDAERALVIGYWVQFYEGMGEFDSHRVNTELKNLGHGVSNITKALTRLINRRPQMVIQTKKSGRSQQARKRYKLTNAGKQAVEQMLAISDGM